MLGEVQAWPLVSCPRPETRAGNPFGKETINRFSSTSTMQVGELRCLNEARARLPHSSGKVSRGQCFQLRGRSGTRPAERLPGCVRCQQAILKSTNTGLTRRLAVGEVVAPVPATCYANICSELVSPPQLFDGVPGPEPDGDGLGVGAATPPALSEGAPAEGFGAVTPVIPAFTGRVVYGLGTGFHPGSSEGAQTLFDRTCTLRDLSGCSPCIHWSLLRGRPFLTEEIAVSAICSRVPKRD